MYKIKDSLELNWLKLLNAREFCFVLHLEQSQIHTSHGFFPGFSLTVVNIAVIGYCDQCRCQKIESPSATLDRFATI